MDIAYDTEFLEDGVTIRPISIGMVAGDGRELYRVVLDVQVISAAWEHPWLRENVIPSLPVKEEPYGHRPGWEWDRDHADWPKVAGRTQIAADVRDFVLAVPDRQLWADYGAYDHVLLCQLWGRMIDLPKGVPMFTCDLKQEAERLGNPALPSLPDVTEHNALSDAREVMYRLRWLRKPAPAGGESR